MFKRVLLGAFIALLGFSSAFAQSGGSTVRPTWFDGPTQYYISTATPLPISGNITANLGGFTPSAAGARGTPLTVTTGDSSGTLPTGAVVAVTNVGANPMYCNVNAIAATVADQYIAPSGGWFAFTIPAAVTTLRCIATGGSTTANTVGGSGLATGIGGTGASSGGGAVTIAAGADVTTGNTTDAACAGDATSGCTVESRLIRIAQNLTTINTSVGSSIPAGASLIGDVNLRQGGTALSATNGIYSNLLQGNTALSTSNPIFITGTGTAGSAATNPITVQGIAAMTPLQIIGPTADGSAAATNPVLIAGTTDGTGTGAIAVPKITAGGVVSVDASASTQPVNVTQVLGSAISATNGLFANVLQGNAVLSATNPIFATDVAGTTGGASSSYLQPTASDNHANIKNGAGTVYSVHTTNNSATKNYLRLYDAGTGFNGCNSATGLIFGMEIPPTDGGFSVSLGGSKGLAFTTGLSICVTSGYGSTDTTNATATAIMSNVLYK